MTAAEIVARAAFMVADAERQAELAGIEPTLETWKPVAEACGAETTILALRVRGRMLFERARALEPPPVDLRLVP